MVRGTKLFQRTGSPLIQGLSKRERPLWQPWLAGFALCVAELAALVTAAGGLANRPGGATVCLGAAFLGGGALGSFVGAYVGRAWGMRARWVFAMIVGSVSAFAAFALVALT